MKKQLISSGAPWEHEVGYSRAVRAGNHIFVSGTTAMKDGEVVGVGDPYAQALRCLEIITDAIREAGGRPEDVVRTRIFITDIAQWPEVARAHGEYFRDIRPAATMVVVNKLILPELLVEIEADALIG